MSLAFTMMRSQLIFAAILLICVTCPALAEADFECPDDSGGDLFPNPENCGSYFVCNDQGISTMILCPPGTLFDPIEEICDHEWNVECDGRPIVPVTTLFPPTTTGGAEETTEEDQDTTIAPPPTPSEGPADTTQAAPNDTTPNEAPMPPGRNIRYRK
jgi:hypothetical protein